MVGDSITYQPYLLILLSWPELYFSLNLWIGSLGEGKEKFCPEASQVENGGAFSRA